MKYLYYSGCSLEGTAREYDMSSRAMMSAFGAELSDVEDWTCCGASAAQAESRLLSLALPARNLALAEQMDHSDEILVPCSACYLNLKKVTMEKTAETLKTVNTILSEDGLTWNGTGSVRHLLDVMATDVGASAIGEKATHPLKDLKIAPYYGCQCLRPYAVFDNPEKPTSMEPIIEALGAEVFPWDMGGKCCGASHMNTKTEVGLDLVTAILKAAKGADAIVTVCPMCQMNLEAYQDRISKRSGENLAVTVLYLPQLAGLAMEIPEKTLGVDLNLAVTPSFRRKLYPG